jgi:hypothetical protein
MVLTHDLKEAVKMRASRDLAFAKAMLDEAATLFLNGEPHTARLILRDLVNASVGFEALAIEPVGDRQPVLACDPVVVEPWHHGFTSSAVRDRAISGIR